MAWEASTGSELTALYDADVQPAASALRMLAEEFTDPRVGAAAGAVMPSNSQVNSIARYAALELYVFHQVIQRARHRLGLTPDGGSQLRVSHGGMAEIRGFPQDELSEDVATSFDLIARGWRTSFRPDAVVTTNVPTTLDQFWRQRQRWTRGLSRAAGRAPGLSALLVASGYADRLVFLAVLVAALSGSLSWFWPCLYFAGPGLNICIALQRAHVSGGILLFVGCLPMFALDVCATLSGTLASLWASKPGWTTRTLT